MELSAKMVYRMIRHYVEKQEKARTSLRVYELLKPWLNRLRITEAGYGFRKLTANSLEKRVLFFLFR